MKYNLASLLPVLALMTAEAPPLCAQNPSALQGSRAASVLLATEGKVDVAGAGQDKWAPAQTNQTLRAGDRLRTGARSRATLQLSDLSVLRVNELTTLEIQAAPEPGGKSILNLKSGSTYLFNREKPSALQFRTPSASGAIRGTEFNLAVDDNGRTVLSMMDGEVTLNNAFGEITLHQGEEAVVEANQPPVKRPLINAISVIQWTLYYPAILDLDEAGLSAAERQALEKPLAAYRRGDLLQALSDYPDGRQPASDAEKIFHAALLLAVGQVGQIDADLNTLQSRSPLAEALRTLVAAVQNQPDAATRQGSPRGATEWLAQSYAEQARSRLQPALDAARAAVKQSPQFGFGWVRVAELEFGFGHTPQALSALNTGLNIAPQNAEALALKGFVLAARNRADDAFRYFNQAIAVDGALGNAWLGRGLVRLRRGEREAGRADLQVAAALEPQRAVLRSYLGKAFVNARDGRRAEKEFRLARELDPNDPTAWLYSALLLQEQNRSNEGVKDLETSKKLNDNRSVYRSRLQLDQDQAVRSANLAALYQDAGMTEVSVREASRAVNEDYGNYSAHLFLANSYDALRDPRLINLRYETPWFSELLVADLLAPISAGALPRNISQQEYSRLFEGDHFGLASGTEYLSSGDWTEYGSQYGIVGNTSYALDAYYLALNGERTNNDLRQLTLSAKIKQQVTLADSLFVQALYFNSDSGDVAQYYNQDGTLRNVPRPDRTERVREVQEPNLFVGWHHEWQPGAHTLFVGGRLNDTFDQSGTRRFSTLVKSNGMVIQELLASTFPFDLHQAFDAYTAELQQIWQEHGHTVIVGSRFQTGETRTTADTGLPSMQEGKTDLQRFSVYGYYFWQIAEPLQLTAGVSYDSLKYPENVAIPPVSNAEIDKARISPKAGFYLTPLPDTVVRGAYTRSLGGVFYDTSVRLEPTQIAGFNQAFRSIIPESTIGLVPGSEFETFGLALDQKFKTETYFSVAGEILRSRADRVVGVFDLVPVIGLAQPVPSGTREQIRFEERSLALTLNQLLGKYWSVGSTYRWANADLTERFVELPAAIAASHDRDVSATLHQVNLFANFNHPSGFFAQAGALWSQQSNRRYSPDIPGDEFWQVNAYLGYRFLRRQAELRLGLLNITDHDYRLNPLNLYSELPRHRTIAASFRFYF